MRRAYAPHENHKITGSRIPIGTLLKQTYKEQTRLVTITNVQKVSHLSQSEEMCYSEIQNSKRSDSMEIIMIHYSLAPQGRQN